MSAELCPVCGASGVTARAGLLECAVCGLAFRAEISFVAPEYGAGLADGIYGPAKKALFSAALDRLGLEFPGGGRLLDIGCASGELLKAAAARGWRAEGVELEPALAQKAAALGFRVESRPVEEAGLEKNAYDAATIFEVFSLMDKPGAAAAELFALLKPGGMLYAREFNAGFHLFLVRPAAAGFFRPLGMRPAVLHNFNFRARTLRALLERAGFSAVRIRNSPPTSWDPYRTGGRLGGFLTGALKVLYYYLAQALWLVTFGRVYAGSSLIVTARKPAQQWPSVTHSV